jgi:TonB family protein
LIGLTALDGCRIKAAGRFSAHFSRAGLRFGACLLLSLLLHLTSGLIFTGSRSAVTNMKAVIRSPSVSMISADLAQTVSAQKLPELIEEAQATPPLPSKPHILPQTDPSEIKTGTWIPPKYFAPEELSRRPIPRDAISLDTLDLPPETASGTVNIRLLLNAEGTVEDVIVGQSTLPQALVNAAVKVFSVASFEPGQIAGTPVRSQYVLEFRYEAPP